LNVNLKYFYVDEWQTGFEGIQLAVRVSKALDQSVD
jgi:hypothetical protein